MFSGEFFKRTMNPPKAEIYAYWVRFFYRLFLGLWGVWINRVNGITWLLASPSERHQLTTLRPWTGLTVKGRSNFNFQVEELSCYGKTIADPFVSHRIEPFEAETNIKYIYMYYYRVRCITSFLLGVNGFSMHCFVDGWINWPVFKHY